MKVSKSFSIDLEVISEMEKRGLGSDFVNNVLREALGLSQENGE